MQILLGADPCEDFSQFSCAGWIQSQTASNIHVFDKTKGQVHEILKSNVYDEKIFECNNCYILFPLLDFLLAPSTPTDPKVFSKVRSYFKSCMSDRNEGVNQSAG